MRALLAGDLGAPRRVSQHARVDHVQAGVEEVRPLHEERALLGEEQRERLIDLELEGVGLDLREVRLHGAAQREVGSEAPARRDAQLAFDVALGENLRGDSGERVGAGCDHGRDDLQVAPRRDAGEALDLDRLAEVAVVVPVARERRPSARRSCADKSGPHRTPTPAGPRCVESAGSRTGCASRRPIPSCGSPPPMSQIPSQDAPSPGQVSMLSIWTPSGLTSSR